VPLDGFLVTTAKPSEAGGAKDEHEANMAAQNAIRELKIEDRNNSL